MHDVILHPNDRQLLTALHADIPHALLFVAPHGYGKSYIAHTWARSLSPFVETVSPDERGSISIETIRTLYQRTRSKRDGHQIIILDHAETMGNEAQNAFLKLLEEPRSGVTFILTAPSAEVLLPTIASRLQVIQLHMLAPAALQEWLKNNKKNLPPQDVAQLLFVARGRPATLITLATDSDVFHRHRHIMQRAKQLLALSPYERLAQIGELTKDRAGLVATLEAMAHMVSVRLAKGDTTWLPAAEALQTCLMRLAQNGNPRAQLTHLFTAY